MFLPVSNTSYYYINKHQTSQTAFRLENNNINKGIFISELMWMLWSITSERRVTVRTWSHREVPQTAETWTHPIMVQRLRSCWSSNSQTLWVFSRNGFASFPEILNATHISERKKRKERKDKSLPTPASPVSPPAELLSPQVTCTPARFPSFVRRGFPRRNTPRIRRPRCVITRRGSFGWVRADWRRNVDTRRAAESFWLKPRPGLSAVPPSRLRARPHWDPIQLSRWDRGASAAPSGGRKSELQPRPPWPHVFLTECGDVLKAQWYVSRIVNRLFTIKQIIRQMYNVHLTLNQIILYKSVHKVFDCNPITYYEGYNLINQQQNKYLAVNRMRKYLSGNVLVKSYKAH